MQTIKKPNVLIQLSKSPVKGQVKTRLISALGEEGACSLHKNLTRYIAESLSKIPGVEHQLWSSSGGNDVNQLVDELSLQHHPQHGECLGERLNHCIEHAFGSYAHVLVIGSDCPFIDASLIKQVLVALENHDVILVPANDGGYVLVGVKSISKYLFHDIPWGTSKVLDATIARLEEAGKSYALLAPLSDIDRPEDLVLLKSISELALPEFS